MLVLSEFQSISGLKVNTEKTKVIKIGDWGDNRTKLCTELNLEWTHTFDCLGVSYDIDNFDNISDQNVEKKKIDIKKIINLWNARYLTPLGKVTIIKSLLISKITHVLLSLPTPSTYILNKLNIIFKNFIWNGKTPKFRNEITENPIQKGGLGLIDLEFFDKALKLSWLKRIYQQTNGWAEFPIRYNIHKLVLYGDRYAEIVAKRVKNKFWADVAKGAQMLLVTFDINNMMDLHRSPLWYNSTLPLQFRSEWAQKGYMLIKDILNARGFLLTLDELHNRNLKINYLDYETLKFNFQKMKWTMQEIDKTIGPAIPRILDTIGISSTGCSNTYKALSTGDNFLLENIRVKWSGVLNEEILLYRIEKAFQCLRIIPVNSYTRYILFKLLHSRIVTNKKLVEMNIADDASCVYCKAPLETLLHAFIVCPTVVKFWKEIENWLQTTVDTHIKIGDVDKILGWDNPEDITSRTIIATIQTIYQKRQGGKEYHLRDVKRTLANQMMLEEYLAGVNNHEAQFEKIWGGV